MNDPHGKNEEYVDSLFDRLKEIKPPLETRISNRKVVAKELSARATTGDTDSIPSTIRTPWWKRSISIPVPVLAASIALMLLLAGFSLRSRETVTAVDQGTIESNEKVADSKHSPPTYRESSVYLCGVGPVQLKSSYRFEE